MNRPLYTAGMLCALLHGLAPPLAEAEATPYARVIVETAIVRAGPAASYRRTYVASRGEVFPIRSRATRGYWFQVELPDSTPGWIAGDAVYTHEVGSERPPSGRFMAWLFAPPPLPGASGEVSLSGGVLGGGGMVALRPSLLLDPSFGFEVSGVAAVATGGRLLQATVGPIVNLFPHAPVVPFATVQGGITASSPNADTFLLDSGSLTTLSAGAGLRFGFHYRLTLRLEVRSHLFFEVDRQVSREEFSAGLTVFY
ncbi:MAG: hypothetical protein PVI30_08335 [Myxococcales bacterium]|jgi:hypothetical protein